MTKIMIAEDNMSIFLCYQKFLSKDENLLEAFKNDYDIHSATAAKINKERTIFKRTCIFLYPRYNISTLIA